MRPFTKISAVLFVLVAIFHLLRLIFHFQVMLLGNEVPQWISVPAIMIASVFSLGLWKEARAN